MATTDIPFEQVPDFKAYVQNYIEKSGIHIDIQRIMTDLTEESMKMTVNKVKQPMAGIICRNPSFMLKLVLDTALHAVTQGLLGPHYAAHVRRFEKQMLGDFTQEK